MDAGIVIVGAGLAGLRTAERLRRAGYPHPITLLSAEEQLPYDRPPLSKQLLSEASPPEPVLLRKADAYAELDVDLRLGTRATALLPDRREVHLDDGSALAYRTVVIATGVRPRILPALDRFGNVHTLRTFGDCAELHRVLRRARRLAVVGGGVLGCEVAASARAIGLEVSLVESLPYPLSRVLGDEVGAAVGRWHTAHGVSVHGGATVESATGDGDLRELRLGTGDLLTADVVLVAVGTVPDTGWLHGSGVELADGVVCDAAGRTSVPDVYAVGDVARFPHPRGGGSIRFEHWTSATDTARALADLLAAAPADTADTAETAAGRPPEVPYFWSDQYGRKLQCLGVPGPGDELTVVEGTLDDERFLALYADDGHITGAVTVGMPGPLMRYRPAVAQGQPLDDVLAAPPWQRGPRPTGGNQP